MPIKLLLAGYLGCGNMGDDAIMVSLHHALADDEYEVRALSGNPDETYRNYKITSIPRRESRAVDDAIDACDALVFPGGSVFQDSTSVKSVYYYSQLVAKAKAKRKKVVLLGQGVGPLTSYFGKRWATAAYNMADAIAVRDPSSMQALRDLGVRTPAKITADLSFLLPQMHQSVESEDFGVGGMRTVGVAPRPLGKAFDSAALFSEFCKLVYQASFMPVLIPMDRNEDTPLIEAITKRHGGRIPDLRKISTPIQIQSRMARMQSVVAMRLHGGILAAGVGVPPLMVSYDPKVAAFSRLLDIGPSVALEGLTPTRLLDTFLSWQRDSERHGKVLERKRTDLYNLAQENIAILKDTVGSQSQI